MRFSTIAASLLVANAAALRIPRQNVVTVHAPVVTEITTEYVTAQPVVEVFTTVVEAAQVAEVTTVVEAVQAAQVTTVVEAAKQPVPEAPEAPAPPAVQVTTIVQVFTQAAVPEVPKFTQIALPTTLITKKASSTSTSAVVIATTTAVAAAPSEDSGSSTDLTEDQQNALDAHNAARSEVGTSALTWDAGLASDAQSWADTLAASELFEHSGFAGQGENLFMQSSSDSPLANAVKMFVDEKVSYSGEAISGTNYHTFGHYSTSISPSFRLNHLLCRRCSLTPLTAQVVWKDTTKVGMASAKSSNGNIYVVARYTAQGNM